MVKWLNKEYTVTMKVWRIILDIIISSIIFTVALYFCITELGADTINSLTWISTEHNELQCALVMFPVIFLIITFVEIGTYVVGSYSNVNKKK